MSGLSNTPIGRFDPKSGLFILTDQWVCPLSGNMVLVVDPGFKSDGASIPKPLQSYVNPRYSAKTFGAAFAHDAMYAGELVDRKDADQEFYRLLKKYGSHEIMARIYFYSVRLFGWIVWLGHSKKSVEKARSLCRIISNQSLYF